jgi:hypothetical protein
MNAESLRLAFKDVLTKKWDSTWIPDGSNAKDWPFPLDSSIRNPPEELAIGTGIIK